MTKQTWKEAQKDTRFIKLSEGNKKLRPNKKTKFLVWSMPIVKTCPFATELCKGACYGAKAYQAYGGNNSNAWISDSNHYELSKHTNFVDDMVWTISQYMGRPSYKSAKNVLFRIHERGDFYDVHYMHKWYRIARRLKQRYGDKIQFIAYTKSIPYIVAVPEIMDVINIRYSVWADTPVAYVGMAKILELPIYTATDNMTAWDGAKCRCADCATCGMCWNMDVEKIACEIH